MTMISKQKLMQAALTSLSLFAFASNVGAQALDQDRGVPRNLLRLGDTLNCNDVKSVLVGATNGAQWLIGDGIPVYPLAESRTSTAMVDGAFAQVNCYAETTGPNNDRRVFVATEDLSSCGWVPRAQLLEEHRREKLDAFTRTKRPICEAARAMPLGEFCNKLSQLSPTQDSLECDGIPPGLRAKGVLLGSDSKKRKDVVFRSEPRGGKQLPERTFFSVLEIHDLDTDETGAPVVLVGDGEGSMFGWLKLEHLEIWPTRLGLFYDAKGKGYLFSELGDLITNWRSGAPKPNIQPGLAPDELEDYVHGNRQLLSYPIVRTVDPLNDIFADPEDPAYHEVIFLGRTGANAAEDLLSQAELADRLSAFQKINVMLVVDTTESMRPYLPLVRRGISDFITKYREDRQNPALRLPDMRMAVYAYSDFKKANATGLNDPIDVATLMPPRAINRGVDLSGPLQVISNHSGLKDQVGLREEAALEAVVQQTRRFETDQGWFKDGPRFVIHLADHGSRKGLDLASVRAELNKVRTKYIPLSIITDDESQSAKNARIAFAKQARETMKTFLSAPTEKDVFTVDLLDFESKTPAAVSDGLSFVAGAVIRATNDIRKTGGDGDTDDERDDAYSLRSRAASQIELSDSLREEFGLDEIDQDVVLRAATGFAPLVIRERGLEETLDWTYTVALDPEQADFLQIALKDLCSAIGTPGQEQQFVGLLVRLAQAFSGDEVQDLSDLYAVLSDMGNLPGANASFLSIEPRVLKSRIESKDPEVLNKLRRDVCWTSYHFTNMKTELYVQPNQLIWTGREYDLKNNETATSRTYKYRPIIGAETVFVPGFFFVLPSRIEEGHVESGFEDFEFFNRD